MSGNKALILSPTSTMSSIHPNLVISPSKAHKILFTKLRNKDTSSADFVKYAQRSMRLLAEDALAEFPTQENVTIPTPCGPFVHGVVPDVPPDRLCAVSIVRSGDALLEAVRTVEPAIRVGKILIQRDESSKDKAAKLFYSKMPPGIADMHILLCDPMLATGGSAKLALEVLIQTYNVKEENIIFANMICAPEGLAAMATAYPRVKIVTVFVDEKLNEDCYIVPGLGDYGDRFFNT